MASTQHWTHSMTPKDKLFYEALGQRMAEFRKAQGLTQTQLAEMLGISQQTVAHYEVGRLRVAVAMLPALTQALGVTCEDLLNEPPAPTKGKRGPTSTLQRQIERVGQLPRAKQKFVMEILETVIQQAS